MAFLTRTELLAAPDLEIEAIPGPQGQGEIGIRLLTGAEREWLIDYVAVTKEREGESARIKRFEATVCALGFCDEHGGRLFSTDEAAALSEKSAMFLQDAAALILKKNKLSQDDMDVLEKKEPADPSAVSGSFLPAP